MECPLKVNNIRLRVVLKRYPPAYMVVVVVKRGACLLVLKSLPNEGSDGVNARTSDQRASVTLLCVCIARGRVTHATGSSNAQRQQRQRTRQEEEKSQKVACNARESVVIVDIAG